MSTAHDHPPPVDVPRESRRFRLGVLLAFLFGFALIAGVAVYGGLESLEGRAARDRFSHSVEVLTRTVALESTITLMEARHRAYLIGGNLDFRRRRDVNHEEAQSQIASLATLVLDNPAQRARLRDVEGALRHRYTLMRESDALAARLGIEAARGDFQIYGSGAIDPIRDALRALRQEEERLLEERRELAELRTRQFEQVLVVGIAVGLLVLVAATQALRVQLRRTEAIGRTLADTNAVQHAMLHGGGVMVIAVHPDGVIRLFNRAASEALGYTAEELVGRQTPAVFHDPDEITRRAAALAEEIGEPVFGFEVFTTRPNRGEVERGEWTYVRKDGSRFPVELAITALRGPEGQALGYIGMALDLSARRAAEDAVRALNAELAAKAEALQMANRELESFSYSVSHDLRAPLRHIDGYARMLSEDAAGKLEPEWQRYLERIVLSARRMGGLIDDLLTFSRLSRATLRRQRVEMRSLVQDVLGDLNEPRGEFEIGELPVVWGDATLLRQVWANLLGNAVKYSAPRGVEARIHVRGSLAGRVARFEVEDNGVGFDMRYRDKLFGVFQRLHTQDQFEGTGVGLAIVQRIVTRHGGRVDADGRPGEGATFRFELPVEVPDE